MSTILNIRGTNGSGKSTAVRLLMKHLGVKSEIVGSTDKVWAYELKQDVYVLGRYETACGGCDTIDSFAKIRRGVAGLAGLGNVVFEGILWSTVFKSSHEFDLEQQANHHTIFALIDTPVEVCVQRVLARRAAKGTTKPYNEAGLRDKYASISVTLQQLAKAGHDTRILPHQNPLPTLLGWLSL